MKTTPYSCRGPRFAAPIPGFSRPHAPSSAAPRAGSRRGGLGRLAGGIVLLLLAVLPGLGADRAATSRAIHDQLATKILPYWYDTAVDREQGGYLLADDLRGRGRATEKQLVGQARMVWGFSHVHLKGFKDDQHDYLAAARQGYQFLLDHFLDREHGGYFWTTDLAGKPVNRRKIIYGESFVIYGMVEYYRASGDRAALDHALELYRVLQQRSHDEKNGGWVEHFEADWTPMLRPGPEAIVEVGGLKSANTHLHLMEALTELYDASHDPAVKRSLEEALRINMTYFYPPDPAKANFHRQPDWGVVTAPSSAGLSYGHNIEFAWLMIRAERVLGREPSWSHFEAHLNHALAHGFDHARGGFYSRGVGNEPASDTDKIWWVEAEGIAALTDALKHRENPDYARALEQTIEFADKYLATPGAGIWMDTVTAEGKPKATGKAHSWKANYHDVRALVKYVEAFR